MSDTNILKERAAIVLGSTGVLVSLLFNVVSTVYDKSDFTFQIVFVVLTYSFIMSTVLGLSVIIDKPHTEDPEKIVNNSIFFFVLGSMLLISFTVGLYSTPPILAIMLFISLIFSFKHIFKRNA